MSQLFWKPSLFWTFVSAAGLIALTGAGSVATAQSDWWKKGRDLLGGSQEAGAAALSAAEIGAGLKEALQVGTETVVAQLGRPGGFSADPKVHIPLPESLVTVQSALDRVGMSAMLDDLEARLNEAAEVATPKAKDLFFQAIAEMTLEDVKTIYEGPDDAATRYFQGKMSRPLAQEMSPIVQASLAEVGAVKAYDDVMGRYRALPFVPDAKADLTAYVVEKGMDGIFYYLAQQEAAIRQDPAKRTTELLRKVFGAS
jgi:hypothetical protein